MFLWDKQKLYVYYLQVSPENNPQLVLAFYGSILLAFQLYTVGVMVFLPVGHGFHHEVT